MNKEEFTFTVFTPTFNRAHTLYRVYESLRNQTFKDFEWIVVDDGSQDSTKEYISKIKKEANFNISYYYKQNGGKHTAINVGVSKAKGKFFLIFDSDDACIPEALEEFYKAWNEIPEKDRYKYAGISAVGMDYNGKIIGTKYPFNKWDISHIDILTKHSVKGDKWGFNRTDILKEYPFPEIPGENFITEGIVWNRISSKYIRRNINNILKIIEYQSDGLSSSMLKIRIDNQ